MFATILCVASCFVIGSDAPSADREDLPAGTLLALENCDSFVETWTSSRVGHVALIFTEDDESVVFEATPGSVRRLAWRDYKAELSDLSERRREKVRARLYVPRKPYDAGEVAAMRCYLEGQLGRRYSVSNYVKGRVGDGTHCAELAANTLTRSERFDFANAHELTPEKLVTAVSNQYEVPREISLPKSVRTGAWTTRCWHDCVGWGKWCRWCCGEAWSWCW